MEPNNVITSKAVAGLATIVSIGLVTLYFYISRRKRPSTLNPEKKVALRLTEKTEISHDTRKFRFALPSPEHILGLPIGNHLSLIADINGETVIRSYTPVSSDDDVGIMDLVIKVYFKNVHPKFPDGGKMTQYLENMKVGDTIDVRGPKGKIFYVGNGRYEVKQQNKTRKVAGKKVGMIAGGSGITPMLQIATEILKNPSDDSQIFLIYANQTPDDILCKDMLGWNYDVGFVTQEMIAKHLPPPGPDTCVLMCGPPPMIKFACMPNLEKIGFHEDVCLKF